MDENRPRHEETDVNVWGVGKFAIVLVLVCIASLALLVGLFHYFMTREGGRLPETAAGLPAGPLPPEPRLQSNPRLDLREMRADEDRVLESYGWVDRQKGVVRIPIERAIDLLAQRGLPSRQQTEPETAAGGVSVPTESGLGEKMLPPGGPLAGEGR